MNKQNWEELIKACGNDSELENVISIQDLQNIMDTAEKVVNKLKDKKRECLACKDKTRIGHTCC